MSERRIGQNESSKISCPDRGQEHVQLIAIDYHTATGTAGAECKETEGQRWLVGWSPGRTPAALWKMPEMKTQVKAREGQEKAM